MNKLKKKVNGRKPKNQPTQLYPGLTIYGSLLYEELRDRSKTDYNIQQFKEHVRSHYQWRYREIFMPEAYGTET